MVAIHKFDHWYEIYRGGLFLVAGWKVGLGLFFFDESYQAARFAYLSARKRASIQQISAEQHFPLVYDVDMGV